MKLSAAFVAILALCWAHAARAASDHPDHEVLVEDLDEDDFPHQHLRPKPEPRTSVESFFDEILLDGSRARGSTARGNQQQQCQLLKNGPSPLHQDRSAQPVADQSRKVIDGHLDILNPVCYRQSI